MAKYKHLIIATVALFASILLSGLVASTVGAVQINGTNLRWAPGGGVTGTVTIQGQMGPTQVSLSGDPLAGGINYMRSGSTCTAMVSMNASTASSGSITITPDGPGSSCGNAGSRNVEIDDTQNAPSDLEGAGEDSDDDAAGGEDDEGEQTSCAIEGTGWMICGIAMTMARAMDGLYGLMEGLLIVPNLKVDINDDSNGMYRAWEIIRNIANLAFVVAFLIIIFSHVTSVGLSNYNVKKMLPRLVISAVLVNISYWIAAAAVDISNLLGNSIHNMLIDIRMNLGDVNLGNAWEILIGGLLAGITVTIAGLAVIAEASSIAAGGGSVVSAAFWIAFPALLGAILAVLVAITIIAVRHALVVILIIVSPLAFVAFLLPNTEKLFNTWRKLLTAMLVFYPLVSLIFAGSQLTSIIILQSLEDVDDGFVSHMVALALFIQVAPLVLLPKIITLGSGMIGRITGVVSNRNRGFIDKAKGVRRRKNERMMGDFRNREPNRFKRGPLKGRRTSTGLLQSGSRRALHGRLDDEAAIKSNESVSQSKWLDSEMGKKSALRTAEAEEELKRASSESAAASERAVPIDLKLKARCADIDKQSAEAETNQAYEEFIANANYQGDKSNSAFASMSEEEFNELQSKTLASKSALDDYTTAASLAKNEQTELRAKAIAGNDEIAAKLGGEGMTASDMASRAAGNVDSRGVAKAVASATATLNAKEGEEVKAERGRIAEAILDLDEKKKVALGGVVTKTTEDGRTFTFDGRDDEIARLAATQEFFAQSPSSKKSEFMNDVNTMSPTQRKVAVEAFNASGAGAKLPQWVGKSGDDITQGRVVKVNKETGEREYSKAQKEIIENEKHLPEEKKTKFLTEEDLMVRFVKEGKFGEKEAGNTHHSAISKLQKVMPQLDEKEQTSVVTNIQKAESNPNMSIDPKAQDKYNILLGRTVQVSPNVLANTSQPKIEVDPGSLTVQSDQKIQGSSPVTAPVPTPAGGTMQVRTDNLVTQSDQKVQGAQAWSGPSSDGGTLRVQHENPPGGGAPQSVQYVTNQDIRSSYNISNQTSNYTPADQRVRTSSPQGTSNYQQAESGLYTPPPPAQQRQAAQRLAVTPDTFAGASPQAQPADFNAQIRQQVQDEMRRDNPGLNIDEN